MNMLFRVVCAAALLGEALGFSLRPNPPNQAQELNATGLIPCEGRNLCSVLLDVPEACVDRADGGSSCPIGFFFHGHGGFNTGFLGPRTPARYRFGGVSAAVHQNGFIGVYPQGAIYAGTNNYRRVAAPLRADHRDAKLQ